MQELALAGSILPTLAALAVSAGFPPITSGAFWAIATLYGVVSILFDDETPRGIPGIEFILEKRRQEAELPTSRP
ncbi:MAG TPA: hypothetical protein VEC38_07120 [Candidatus Binataceae bacterium]|nr:hypothetical protein [Candidatus Binataceae bacterium]